MLKTCFECLVGTNNIPEHETYGTRLNGHNQTTMSKFEDIFKLPKPLKINDVLSVRGDMSENRDRLFFKLLTGAQAVVFQMGINFSNDNITLKTNHSDSTYTASLTPSSIFYNSEFSLQIQVRENPSSDSEILMDIVLGGNSLDTINLYTNDLKNIEFFTLSNSVLEVKELTFTYA